MRFCILRRTALKLELSREMAEQVAAVYEDMEKAYDEVATLLKLSCNGCPDNCCDSYFLHFTYIEWAYLWYGLGKIPVEIQKKIRKRAENYVKECAKYNRQEDRPQILCPLNEEGKCVLYPYRLMVCRTHGVPASMTRPDGRKLSFPGCFVCQRIVEQKYPDQRGVPVMERTSLLRRLVLLEQEFLGGRRHVLPKVRMTIADMLVTGPPEIPNCSDGCCTG